MVSKVKLLFDVVDGMRSLADSIQAMAEAIADNESAPNSPVENENPGVVDTEKNETPKAENETPVLTETFLREFLGTKMLDAARELVHSFGVTNLGKIGKEHYAELYAKAQLLPDDPRWKGAKSNATK